MAQRKKIVDEKPAGAPEWMMTYGDMMSLLLCFFIMLVAMSEIKEDKFQKLLESLRRAFGYEEGTNTRPVRSKLKGNSLKEMIQMMKMQGHREDLISGAESINVRGKEFLCTTVEEGLKITVGDKIGFKEGSAAIPDEMKDDLDALVGVIEELPNRVLVRGHCSSRYIGTDGMDAMRLSFLRARAVGDHLTSKGIHPMRIRLSACGSNEPVQMSSTPEARARNRRVEVIINEQLVENIIPWSEINE